MTLRSFLTQQQRRRIAVELVICGLQCGQTYTIPQHCVNGPAKKMLENSRDFPFWTDSGLETTDPTNRTLLLEVAR